MAAVVATGIPGASLVVREGGSTNKVAVGVAETRTKVALKVDHRFRIGSLARRPHRGTPTPTTPWRGSSWSSHQIVLGAQLDQRIFKPLQLASTSLPTTSEIAERTLAATS